MPRFLDSPQPSINVCANIKCPFFNEKSSSSQGCARYSKSGQCHLTSVFAFKSEGDGLFTANKSTLPSIKRANDGWISQDKISQRLLDNCHTNGCFQQVINRASNLYNPPLCPADNDQTYCPKLPKKRNRFQPISIRLLHSIQFEPY